MCIIPLLGVFPPLLVVICITQLHSLAYFTDYSYLLNLIFLINILLIMWAHSHDRVIVCSSVSFSESLLLVHVTGNAAPAEPAIAEVFFPCMNGAHMMSSWSSNPSSCSWDASIAILTLHHFQTICLRDSALSLKQMALFSEDFFSSERLKICLVAHVNDNVLSVQFFVRGTIGRPSSCCTHRLCQQFQQRLLHDPGSFLVQVSHRSSSHLHVLY